MMLITVYCLYEELEQSKAFQRVCAEAFEILSTVSYLFKMKI